MKTEFAFLVWTITVNLLLFPFIIFLIESGLVFRDFFNTITPGVDHTRLTQSQLSLSLLLSFEKKRTRGYSYNSERQTSWLFTKSHCIRPIALCVCVWDPSCTDTRQPSRALRAQIIYWWPVAVTAHSHIRWSSHTVQKSGVASSSGHEIFRRSCLKLNRNICNRGNFQMSCGVNNWINLKRICSDDLLDFKLREPIHTRF